MILINRLPFFKRKDRDRARFERLARRLESPIERIFWREAYGPLSALGRLTPQVKVEGYRVDFALTDVPGVDLLRVVIELDGHDFHSTLEKRNYDTSRDRALMKAGWQVIRFTGSQINGDCAGCVRETVEMVRAWSKLLRYS
jgi:very-short-patch-repair endonuclease